MVINRKIINKKDWKSFVTWSANEFYLFKNPNFYTGFISINQKVEIEKYLIDFFIYNKYILEDRYFFEWPNWIKKIKGTNIDNWILNLFKLKFESNIEIFILIKNFLSEMQKYKKQINKDWNREYELALMHSEFTTLFRKKKVYNYNEWIIYINKHIHINLKGYK